MFFFHVKQNFGIDNIMDLSLNSWHTPFFALLNPRDGETCILEEVWKGRRKSFVGHVRHWLLGSRDPVPLVVNEPPLMP